MITDPGIATEVTRVWGVVSRALHVFGGSAESRGLPLFAAPRDIEDNLGRGRF